jgi:osmotically-inducible protein OsmY
VPSKSEPILGHPWQTNFRGKLSAAEKAVAIAQSVKGVISVENHVKIVAEK